MGLCSQGAFLSRCGLRSLGRMGPFFVRGPFGDPFFVWGSFWVPFGTHLPWDLLGALGTRLGGACGPWRPKADFWGVRGRSPPEFYPFCLFVAHHNIETGVHKCYMFQKTLTLTTPSCIYALQDHQPIQSSVAIWCQVSDLMRGTSLKPSEKNKPK